MSLESDPKQGVRRPAEGLFCVWCNTPSDGSTFVNTSYLALSVPVCLDAECINEARANDMTIALLAQENGNHKEGRRALQASA